jgi:hypothetical protein
LLLPVVVVLPQPRWPLCQPLLPPLLVATHWPLLPPDCCRQAAHHLPALPLLLVLLVLLPRHLQKACQLLPPGLLLLPLLAGWVLAAPLLLLPAQRLPPGHRHLPPPPLLLVLLLWVAPLGQSPFCCESAPPAPALPFW